MSKYTCLICNKTYKVYQSLSNHIKVHKITIKEYYDIFIKKKNEEICKNPSCSNITSFLGGWYGYSECCSQKCACKYLKITGRKKLVKIKNNNNTLCDYGCGNLAKYQNPKSGKYCCFFVS